MYLLWNYQIPQVHGYHTASEAARFACQQQPEACRKDRLFTPRSRMKEGPRARNTRSRTAEYAEVTYS